MIIFSKIPDELLEEARRELGQLTELLSSPNKILMPAQEIRFYIIEKNNNILDGVVDFVISEKAYKPVCIRLKELV